MKRNYLRWHVFERDSYTCILCSAWASDLHHVIPRSQGGSNYPDNLVSLCRCHHMVIHGQRVHGIDMTTEECRRALLEYVCDFYAEKWRGYGKR